ncbi:MAG TPA: menaquinone biosynthesis decarboxylase [Thermoanaerobaculia bacterium]|nr:menaquinone biosynthesis decarboxylase [Thermoanaerobaculia bacterium]
MAFRDLRHFLDRLDKAGELARIRERVSARLEISEITDRVSKRHGPALLFENVEGSDIPVVINLLGSERRMKMALGIEAWEEWSERLDVFLDPKLPTGIVDKIRMLPTLGELARVFPKIVSSAPCQEVVLRGEEVDLGRLPIITCWPEDGGPFITMPLVFTKDPKSGKRNCGMYRMQVYDRNTTGMHWQLHKDAARQHQDAEAGRLERIPVSVAIGSDPVTVFSAVCPLPPDIDEMMFAGFARNDAVRMVKCITNDLEVPANAEIVLEGWVNPAERRMEGPFGDHTGFYTPREPYAVFHVDAITHRRNPIYLTTIVGKPPQEDAHMGLAIERLFLPIMKKQFPEIVDMHMPPEGVFHNLMILAIRKRYPGHARKIMHGIWGLGQAMFTKVIVVVDHHIDPHDLGTVAWYALNNIDPERDTEMVMGPIDVLDHSSRAFGYGSHIGIDGTKKLPEEGFTRVWPEEIEMSAEVRGRIDAIWGKLNLD